jgi:putative DNA primase/helicase
VVLEANQQYRDEEDVLGRFIEDCYYKDPNGTTLNKELRERYETWCKENGETPESPRVFWSQLTNRGFLPDRNMKTRFRRGLTLKEKDE